MKHDLNKIKSQEYKLKKLTGTEEKKRVRFADFVSSTEESEHMSTKNRPTSCVNFNEAA